LAEGESGKDLRGCGELEVQASSDPCTVSVYRQRERKTKRGCVRWQSKKKKKKTTKKIKKKKHTERQDKKKKKNVGRSVY